MQTMIAVAPATEVILAKPPAYNAAGSAVNLPSTYQRANYDVGATTGNPQTKDPREVVALLVFGAIVACFLWNYDGRR